MFSLIHSVAFTRQEGLSSGQCPPVEGLCEGNGGVAGPPDHQLGGQPAAPAQEVHLGDQLLHFHQPVRAMDFMAFKEQGQKHRMFF